MKGNSHEIYNAFHEVQSKEKISQKKNQVHTLQQQELTVTLRCYFISLGLQLNRNLD